ncbi:uncharacterized protein N0V89_000440 [Didymosphaeria variabile]|uniref:Uncharacterized protein n=1 Tax=Didymosphaeria variabile TaxID=1932322 RepID=A0A9W9CFQ1_9PLEO|nr:uncharacterized protein N0V89_000440 [Didymosphaeria variabile]KAJ4359884.1 hypothetical protein N0V89_000440 [Didymosphaeria variabile]
MAPPGPRVEVTLRATRICFLSNSPTFNFVLLLTLHNSPLPVTFLKDGAEGLEKFQPVNSDQIVQCFDSDTGEQVHIIRSSKEYSFLRLEPNRGNYVTFTTSKSRKDYEMPFVLHELRPDKKYRLCFRPTSSITHWSFDDENTLNTTTASEDSATPLPDPSPTLIPWTIVSSPSSLIFSTRSAPLPTPTASVSLSAPSTFSLSQNPPFRYTLTFSTSAPNPINVLAMREAVRSSDADIELRDPLSGARLGPEMLDDGNEDGPYHPRDFLRLDGAYTEHRELDLTSPHWQDVKGKLSVGEEYVLRYVGGKWEWWTEDTIEEVMMYAGERGGMGLTESGGIEIEGRECRFRVVE